MKIKVNDKVLVIAGKDRGKTGKVTKVSVKHNRVVVEKINIRTKHIRKTTTQAGSKIQYEAPINASNVMILDPKENKPTRVGYRKAEGGKGKKERYSKLSGLALDNIATPKETKTKSEKGDKKTSSKETTKESTKKTTKSTKPKTIKA